MASIKISEMPVAGPLTGDEVFEIVQGGQNVKLLVSDVQGSGTGAVESVNGETGVVVLDSDDVVEGTANKYYPSADSTKLAGIEAGAQVNTVTSVNTKTGAVNLTASDVSAIPTSEKGVASGVATLGTDGKVPSTQLPEMTSGGAVDSVNGQTGTVVLDSDGIAEGTTNKYYPSTDASKLAGIAEGAEVNAVDSVNGYTGVVELSASDVGAIGDAPVDGTAYNRKDGTWVVASAGSGGVALFGPVDVGFGKIVTYTITNYNAFDTYAVAATNGTVSRADDVISYTAPGTGTSDTLSVTQDGTTYSFVITLDQVGLTGEYTQLTGGGVARDWHCVEQVNGILYAFGGQDSGNIPLNDLWKYDPSTDTWTQLTSGATARHSAACATVNGELYISGGRDASNAALADLWKYDPSTDTWTQLTNCPVARYRHGACAVGGELYVFGDPNNTSNDLWKYDPSTDTWTQLTSGATARSMQVMEAIDDKVYVFGGYIGSNTNTNDLWKYDPSTDTWTQLTSGATARQGATGGSIDGGLYIFGGNDGAIINDLWKYDPSTDTWTQLTSGATARMQHKSAVIEGSLYIYAGANTNGAPLSDIWRID